MPVIVLGQERVIKEIIADSLRIAGRDWWSLYAVTAPYLLLSILLVLVGLLVVNVTWLDQIFWLITLPVDEVASGLVSAAAIALLIAKDSGRATSVGIALDAAQDRAGDVAYATLKSLAIFMLLFVTVIGIPWAIKRLVLWMFVVQAVMIDGQTGSSSLACSATLVKGRWWKTAARLFVCLSILGFPFLAATVATSLLAPGLLGSILGAALSFIGLPLGIIATTLVYFDLKVTAAAKPAFGAIEGAVSSE